MGGAGASASDGAARTAAATIHRAFERYFEAFGAVTRRAAGRFLAESWGENQIDAIERLELYARAMEPAVEGARAALGDHADSRRAWKEVREHYRPLVADRPNFELAETFHDSVVRRALSLQGVEPEVEFLAPARLPRTRGADSGIFQRHVAPDTETLVRDALAAHAGGTGVDPRSSGPLATQAISRYLRERLDGDRVEWIEMLRRPFYRGNAAYLVGRLASCNQILPLAFALRRHEGRTHVDAVLLNDDEVSILFSFTRAYFHLESDCPRETVTFLRSILPRKPVSELYTALGFNRHGKRELFADLQRHLERTDERFEIAPGDTGMVMLVFTLKTYDAVFKVIRDRFAEPKKTTRREVRERYELVFRLDRVGRLIDAQQFEDLTFDRSRFDPVLLEELAHDAGALVAIDDSTVSIRHLYTERKVTPLNLYLRRAEEDAAVRAMVDYGRAIKQLAAANIFPGDFLLKNFGVTRHGRVVFYDYDELCLLEECRFRRLPPPRSPEEELDPEPWFRVGPMDVFPEEFRRFLGLGGRPRDIFDRHHADLFSPDYWKEVQQRIRDGEIMEFFPYPQRRRLPPH